MRPELTDEQHRQLTREWHPDSDGILHRDAARVVLFDDAGRIYLIRGHDFGETDHWWWFTVGGGIEPGETAREGAVREVREETGLIIPADRLRGPAFERHAEFHFAYETRRQDELFFFVHVTPEECSRIGRAISLTALEDELIDEWRWWGVAEIREARSRGIAIYPEELADLADRWLNGWDGNLSISSERT